VGVRLIAGRAGSGKTYWCRSQIGEALASSLTEGPRLVMLVPEQAALQMERGLLAMSAVRALGRGEVLSFRRLAHRILNEATGPMPATLTPIGRQMALRHLITRHRRQLQEFGKVAERGGFVAAIARGIVELLQEAVPAEQLQAAAEAADDAGDPSAPRLHDAALLYQAYLEYLGSQRVDPEGVLDLARGRLGSVPWLEGARLWIDGFAGLTQQQVRMVVALAQRGSHLDIALLLDPTRRKVRDLDSAPDDLSLFARTERTWFTLVRALSDAGVAIEEPIFLGRTGCPRFARAGALAQLECRLFTVPIPPHRKPAGQQENDAAGRRGPDQTSPPGATVRLMKAPDRRAEVAAAVRALLDLVQQPDNPLRYREAAIVVRDLEPYHDLISASLRAHHIPFFIDRRRPTYHHPLVQLVRGTLMMHADGPFDRAVLAVLKSGLSGLTDQAVDALENYLLAHGLITAEIWDEEWTYPLEPRTRDREESPARRDALKAVNQSRNDLRQRLGQWWPTPASKRGQPACRKWAERLCDLLQRLGVTERLAEWCDDAAARADLDEAEEHQQVWTDLVKLLEELVETLGDERMTGRQFREVLESGLSEFTLGLVPATVDQVLVSSVERSRHPPIRAVFVLGFEDGQFPARPTEETILGDAERNRIEACHVKLGRTRAQQLLDERMLAYVAVTRPSEFLWVSYPQSNESGKPLSPSPYWTSLRAALPDIPVEMAKTSGPEAVGTAAELAGGLASHLRAWGEDRADLPDHDTWLSLYEWMRSQQAVSQVAGPALSALGPPTEARLSANATAALWRPPYRTSVTRLEQHAWCPFQHFAARGLDLKQRPVHEISALDMGSLYHTVLEQFVNELMETGRSLGDLSTGEIARSLGRWSKQAIDQHAEQVRMQDQERDKAAWRSGLELPAALTGQQTAVGKSPLRPLATEQSFGSPEEGSLPALELKTSRGQTVLVRGKIDRVDLLSAGDVSLAVVLDYKRSLRPRLLLDEAYHGLALQLLTYLLVIQERGKDLAGADLLPGGAFYVPLLASYEKVDHPADAEEEAFNAYKPYRPRGVLDFDWIDRLDPQLKSGWSSMFSVFRTARGELGHVDRSDAVPGATLPAMLQHIRGKITELAEDWVSGNIAVAPARLGKELPCSHCPYRSVCRYEFVSRQARCFPSMSRSQVLAELAGREGGTDG
jgi:ATP-dependent helicase/nuclease subunit B